MSSLNNEWCRLELRLISEHRDSEVLLSKHLTLRQNLEIYFELTHTKIGNYLLVRTRDNHVLNREKRLSELNLSEGERLDIYPVA